MPVLPTVRRKSESIQNYSDDSYQEISELAGGIDDRAIGRDCHVARSGAGRERRLPRNGAVARAQAEEHIGAEVGAESCMHTVSCMQPHDGMIVDSE